MNLRGVCVIIAALLLGFTPTGHALTNEPVRVFMPDGQLQSHLLRVYVSTDLTEADRPTVSLLAGQLFLARLPAWAERPITNRELARFQHWTENVDGVQVSRTGTLLLLDLRKTGFPFFKACMRVTPVVKWGDGQHSAIGEKPVYLGNLKGAFTWTVGILVLVLFALHYCTRPRPGDEPRPADPTRPARNGLGAFRWLLLGPDGRLSLSKSQAAVWTLCIGGVVFAFALIRLQPPAIPETLVALMGLSLATRAVTYSKEASVVRRFTPEWGDLIRSPKGDQLELSVTKAQMVFWTCLVACLFVVKSLLDGELWDVPWQLVTLMGMSQASYMYPIVNPKTPPAGPPTTESKAGEKATPPAAPPPKPDQAGPAGGRTPEPPPVPESP